MKGKSLFLLGLLFAVATSWSAESSFYRIRLRAEETDSPKVWAETLKALVDYKGSADEIWFSTGISYPPLETHRQRAALQAKAADDCRKIGIAPGLQIQATLGHSDSIGANGGDMSAMDWTGWTGSQGVVDRYCSCPRDPKFIAYFAEVARIYAAYRPTTVWIDDDLRIDNHNPASNGSLRGCWCQRCVADFSRAMNGPATTRVALARDVATNAHLRTSWERFQYLSLAEFSRQVAKAIHAVSPETRLGYQHALRADGLQTLVFDGLAEASRHQVLSRPGGGAYYDHDPHSQILKAYLMMRQRQSLRAARVIDGFCPEIETCPRAFACRTPRGVLLEAIENISLGMDTLSFLISDSRFEKMSWYGQTFFRALSENRACLKGLAEKSEGTFPSGLLLETPQSSVGSGVVWSEVCSGIPLIHDIGVATGKYADFVKLNGGQLNVTCASTSGILRRVRLADEVSNHRLPVVLEDPLVAFVMPRVTASRELKTVTIVNTTIGLTAPTRLRLRGVAPGLRAACWRPLDAQPLNLAIVREGNDAIVTLPSIPGWSAGWLDVSPSDGE